MALTVGTDSYITIAEADAYIKEHYVSTDTQRIAWDALSDADKEIYLRNATAKLEKLQYIGQKYNADVQALSFPRIVREAYPYRREDREYFDYAQASALYSVPQAVKNAQAEEALELCSPSGATKGQEARRGSVKQYSIGHLSEVYQLGARTILNSLKAQELLEPYIGGGFGVV